MFHFIDKIWKSPGSMEAEAEAEAEVEAEAVFRFPWKWKRKQSSDFPGSWSGSGSKTAPLPHHWSAVLSQSFGFRKSLMKVSFFKRKFFYEGAMWDLCNFYTTKITMAIFWTYFSLISLILTYILATLVYADSWLLVNLFAHSDYLLSPKGSLWTSKKEKSKK